MNKKVLLASLLVCLAIFTQCKEKQFRIQFDSTKEVSGQKFSIADISPGLPANWDEYNFVVVEFKISTAQRFHIGFTTDDGYNELRIMSYVPNAWNKLAIPLEYYTSEPRAAVDLAATYNHSRYTGWINLGGKRGPMHGVDSIGIRMRKPIGNPTFEIRSISLAVEDPGDQYLEEFPAVDEFGQSNLVEYDGKAKTLEQLEADWRAEEEEMVTTEAYNYSRYGGYKQKRVEATGYFRVEQVDGRWWFVDPEGYLFLSVGVDCISTGGGGNIRAAEQRANMYKTLPPADLIPRQDQANQQRRNANISFGNWNLIRRYGDDYRAKSIDMLFKRMDKWGVNTIGNWSSGELFTMGKKAYFTSLRGIGIDRDLMGLSDVYNPNFQKVVDESIKSTVEPYKNDPWLVGYFVANEPAWLGQESRLCSLILEGQDKPIKTELQKYLVENGDTPESRKDFIYSTFETFLRVVDKTLKKHDPNHMNVGIRFGSIAGLDERLFAICKETFNILSFNCYDLSPDKEVMDRALKYSGLPMIIGEYHFGTVDRGMAQSLWQVNSQEERGVAYRYYTEQAYSHPGLIGTAYFQWCDQDLTGRNDGENYNCGLVDVTDRPYKYQVEAMMETAKVLYDVHSGAAQPYNRQPVDARGHGTIPDLWNE